MSMVDAPHKRIIVDTVKFSVRRHLISIFGRSLQSPDTAKSSAQRALRILCNIKSAFYVLLTSKEEGEKRYLLTEQLYDVSNLFRGHSTTISVTVNGQKVSFVNKALSARANCCDIKGIKHVTGKLSRLIRCGLTVTYIVECKSLRTLRTKLRHFVCSNI